jgi:hypothetical protein
MTQYDPLNKAHIAIQRRQAKAEDDTRDTFIQHSMGVVEGRMYFHALLVRCHVFANPYAANGRSTAFNCGELNIGQQVLADIMRLCPDEYVQMMREANARELATDTRLTRSNEDRDRDDPGPRYVHPAFDATAEHNDYTPGPDSEDE